MEPARKIETDTATLLLDAAERSLRQYGMAALSTRKVAEEAGMPLSQIHYHFGSKQGLLLALLNHLNSKLIARQRDMFSAPLPLSQRWKLACDYLEEDLASGYVRVLHEMVAAGWSDPALAEEVRRNLKSWYELLIGVTQEAMAVAGNVGPFTAREIAALVGNCFLGTESMILIGFTEEDGPILSALRKVGTLLELQERNNKTGADHASQVS